MRPERARALSDLLREMREADDGFFPDEAWSEIHRNFALPYVEVALTRVRAGGGREVFLTRRAEGDLYWPGRPWHIPGGLWRVAHTLEEACAELAQREVGVGIMRCHEVMTFKWPDHPYGNPISHVCLCEPSAPPTETADARFFGVEHPPRSILAHHDTFLAACRSALEALPPFKHLRSTAASNGG